MKKYILFCASFALIFAESYNPDKISKKDLNDLLKLDSNLYSLAKKKAKPKSVDEIFNFIWINREIKIQPLQERISLDLIGFAGGRNRSGIAQNVTEFDYTLNPYAYIGLQGGFKIIDPREAREKKEEILKQRAQILKKVENFAEKHLEIQNLTEQIEVAQHKENLYKIRVSEGVEYRETRIKNLESLLKIKHNRDKARLDLESLKIELLDLVKIESRLQLKEMIQ